MKAYWVARCLFDNFVGGIVANEYDYISDRLYSFAMDCPEHMAILQQMKAERFDYVVNWAKSVR